MMVETEDPDPPMLKLKIDGEESVTLAPGDNRTFRYSAVIGEWRSDEANANLREAARGGSFRAARRSSHCRIGCVIL